ncbi:hypothetical protein [Lentzea sp. NPDC055074]
MTQPPQWGGPPHRPPPGHPHPQHWPQQQGPPPGWLPPRPSQLGLLAVLNWVLAAGMLAIAAFVIMSFLVSGGTLVVGVLLAAVVAGFGVLNALGALSINHPHFPNTVASQLAGGFTGIVLLVALIRSVRRGVAELVPATASAVLLAVCVLSLVLATRPAVKRWIVAKHQQSLSHGHVPRNRR